MGAKHGRVLPLVGNTRPYMYDVAIVGTDSRIYADRLTDILCVLIGEEYQQNVEALNALGVFETTDIGSEPGLGDILPMELATSADEPADTGPSLAQSQAYQQAQSLLYDLGLLRTAFAENLRVDLQAAINADAVADGSWLELTDAEREELVLSATRGGGFPIGIPGEIAVWDETADPPAMVPVVRPEWRSAIRLVINTGNYLPWTPAPFIESLRTAVDTEGITFEYPTSENVVLLDVNTEEEFIESLIAINYLTMATRPSSQPDPAFQKFVDDPIVYPYLRRNQRAEDAADANP
ncbi:hypothetical protein ACFQNE_02980 [Gordonia phosphorivorans]|uniref:Uncharacterized protein n=1 Tax=Gordonia phosphorivorans TaxID=1056982 RepID=A0ABV6H3Z1_9ACTN